MRKADEVCVDLLSKGLPTNYCKFKRDILRSIKLPFHKKGF